MTTRAGSQISRAVAKARSHRFEVPAARDLIHAADNYERLAYDLKHLQEMHRRIRHQLAAIRSPAVRRLETLKLINTSLLVQRKCDEAEAKTAFQAALARYAALASSPE